VLVSLQVLLELRCFVAAVALALGRLTQRGIQAVLVGVAMAVPIITLECILDYRELPTLAAAAAAVSREAAMAVQA
jgi:hypothetical protein